MDFDQFTVRFKRGDYRKYVVFLVLHFTFGMQIRHVVAYKTSHFARAFSYAPINGMPPGGGGRAWGGDLIVFVGPGVGHLTDLVLPGEGIFESFFARRGDI